MAAKSLWTDLRKRLALLTRPRGARAALARLFRVSPQAVNQWLSGDSNPTAETTLRLLQWVEQEEAKQKTLGGACNTAKSKRTRARKSSENPTQSPKGK